MKKLSLVLFVITLLCFNLFGAAKAKITFKVIDDFWQPVEGAPVTLSAFDKWVPGPGMAGTDKYKKVSGITNEEGIVVLSIRSKESSVKYGVYDEDTSFSRVTMDFGEKEYYRNQGGRVLFSEENSGKWFPWNEIVEIIVKPVVNPIPMYACSFKVTKLSVPVFSVALGYDLIKSDWLPPYGNGEVADFVFRLDREINGYSKMDRAMMFDGTLSLSFSNEDDGIQEILINPRKGSVLKLPRYAPESAYIPKLKLKSYENESDSFDSWNEDQNYFFRVRTKKDEDGNIVSALYGKLDGPISYRVWEDRSSIQMLYYINPNPNDRNLEFDINQNLFSEKTVRGVGFIQRP